MCIGSSSEYWETPLVHAMLALVSSNCCIAKGSESVGSPEDYTLFGCLHPSRKLDDRFPKTLVVDEKLAGSYQLGP